MFVRLFFALPTSITPIVFFPTFHLHTHLTRALNSHLTSEPAVIRLLHKCVSGWVGWGDLLKVCSSPECFILSFFLFFRKDTHYAICLDYLLGVRRSDCEPSGRQTLISAGPGVFFRDSGEMVGGGGGQDVPGKTFSSRYVFTSFPG